MTRSTPHFRAAISRRWRIPPDIPGDWVLWQRVDSFVGQGGDARVFRLDPANGTVAFGDGRQGKIPPAGREGIRAFRYQQGGGEQGNVGAYAIKNLKTALESVEAVTNPVEATGGIDTPDVDRLIATAPTRLRNANRALSGADMEALAVSSSPDVVRARHIMPREAKDKMRLAVAVRTGQPCPQPSIARRKALAKYILEHAAGMLEPDALDVIPPQYVPVSVTVELLADSSDLISEVETEARRAACRVSGSDRWRPRRERLAVRPPAMAKRHPSHRVRHSRRRPRHDGEHRSR